MHLKHVSLQHYRNISDLTLDLHPQLTILLGPNGVGKTNILEAIHLLSLPRSFRGGSDAELVEWGQDYARVEGHVLCEGDPERTLAVFIQGQKKLSIDGQLVSTSDFLGHLLAVLFAPEEVDLLASTPQRRRAFIDGHLSLLSRAYFSHLILYQKIVARRNKILRLHRVIGSELDYWNEEQINHGTALIEARISGMAELQSFLPAGFTLQYHSSLDVPGRANFLNFS